MPVEFSPADFTDREHKHLLILPIGYNQDGRFDLALSMHLAIFVVVAIGVLPKRQPGHSFEFKSIFHTASSIQRWQIRKRVYVEIRVRDHRAPDGI